MYASKESTDIAFLTYLLVEAYLFCSKRGKILKYRNLHKDSDGRKKLFNFDIDEIFYS